MEKIIKLYQPIDGYCYNSDTMFLYDFISKFEPKEKVLDIGSGSGVLGLLIARDFQKVELESIEIQKEFQFLTHKNSEINNIKNKNHKTDFLNFDTKTYGNYYSFVISNPPFYDQNVIKSKNKSLNIARYNNHLPLQEFFSKVAKILKNRGSFIFCYDAKQLENILIELKNARLKPENIRFVHSKESKDSSIVMIQARKNSNSFLKILSPLIVFNKKNEYTSEVKNIYRKANTYTFKCKI
jgi:tRNA1(Val) A37 N6-methylase TrmN6